jgi:tetratricopeptide (TPR) repeat protein
MLVAMTVCSFAGCVSVAAQTGPTSSDLLEDHPEKLVPKKERTAEDQDRILAETLFTHGRMLLQRDQSAEALARFERAFRYDPAPVIAQEIVRLASELNRHAEAVRYAVASARLLPPTPELAVRLAAIVAGQEDYATAIQLLDRALQPGPAALAGVNAVLVRAELMRLHLLAEQPEPAASAADIVWNALSDPARAGLSENDHRKVAEQKQRLKPLIAESFLRVHRHADAEKVFRSMDQDRPNAAVLAWQLARIAADQKNWKSAREQLTKYFDEQATAAGFEPYELLTRMIQAEQPDESRARQEIIAALRKLRELDVKNNPLAYFLAGRLMEAEDWGAAAKLYEELLERQPTTTAFRDLAQIYRHQKNSAALLNVIRRAVDQGGSRELLGTEGALIAKDEALLGQLLNLAKQPVSGESTPSVSALVGTALLAMEARQVDTVRELYRHAVAIPDADLVKIREPLGLAALIAGQQDLAAEIFEQAIAANPPKDKLAAYYYYLSGARELAGDTTRGLAAAEKCAELNRESVTFQMRPAWVLYHARKLAQAEARYREVIEQFDRKFQSDEIRDQVRQARMILSNICVMQKQLPAAEEWLEQVLDEFPEDIGARNDLGYLWADQGKRLPRALQMIEQAVAADVDNAAYRDSLGWVYYRLGRFHDAVRELERAAAAQPDGVIFDHLGDAYWKVDDRQQALKAWKQGVELLTDAHEEQQRGALAEKIKQHSPPNP